MDNDRFVDFNLDNVDRELDRLVDDAEDEARKRQYAVRAEIIRLWSQGQSIRRTAEKVGLSPVSVKKWRDRYRGRGADGLKDAGNTRRNARRYTNKDEERIFQALTSDQGLTGPELSERFGVSPDYAWRIMRKYRRKLRNEKKGFVPTAKEFMARRVNLAGLYLHKGGDVTTCYLALAVGSGHASWTVGGSLKIENNGCMSDIAFQNAGNQLSKVLTSILEADVTGSGSCRQQACSTGFFERLSKAVSSGADLLVFGYGSSGGEVLDGCPFSVIPLENLDHWLSTASWWLGILSREGKANPDASRRSRHDIRCWLKDYLKVSAEQGGVALNWVGA